MPRRRVVISDFVAGVGARVRELRFERKLSIRKLAELSGCSAAGIMEIELGRSALTTRTLGKLATALGVKPADILNHAWETDDVGWLLETMRREAKWVKSLRARVKSPRFPRPPQSPRPTSLRR